MILRPLRESSTHSFGIIPRFFPGSLCSSCARLKFHFLCIRSFFLEHPILFEIVLVTGGGLNPGCKSLYSFIYVAFGAVVAVEVFIVFILSVLARHANLI